MNTARIAYAPGYSFRTSIRGHMVSVIVLRYHGAGTCDVQTEDGRRYRVSGLPLVRAA